MHFFSRIISLVCNILFTLSFFFSICPSPLVYLSLWLFNVLALFRVQWRSRIQDICFHFHPNSITSFTHSSTKPIDNYYINDGTVAAVMKESHPWINWLLLRIFLCVFTQSPFYNKQRNPIKVRQVKVHLQQQQLWCGVPLPLHAFEHFELLPAIVSLHPGLSRWSPILGDEGHPRKTVRKLAPHTHSSMNQLQYLPTQFSQLSVHVATRF